MQSGARQRWSVAKLPAPSGHLRPSIINPLTPQPLFLRVLGNIFSSLGTISPKKQKKTSTFARVPMSQEVRKRQANAVSAEHGLKSGAMDQYGFRVSGLGFTTSFVGSVDFSWSPLLATHGDGDVWAQFWAFGALRFGFRVKG